MMLSMRHLIHNLLPPSVTSDESLHCRRATHIQHLQEPGLWGCCCPSLGYSDLKNMQEKHYYSYFILQTSYNSLQSKCFSLHFFSLFVSSLLFPSSSLPYPSLRSLLFSSLLLSSPLFSSSLPFRIRIRISLFCTKIKIIFTNV